MSMGQRIAVLLVAIASLIGTVMAISNYSNERQKLYPVPQVAKVESSQK